MEAHFQIVGCLVASRPAVGFVEGFVAQVRRERAVVTSKTAREATFVRFNAPDATLVTMACQAIVGPGGSALRFGFASGVKERAQSTQDSLSISNRSIALARDLAAVAAKGEVLVSPQLAVGLVESGFTFQTREVSLAGGRKVMACALDVRSVPLDEATGEGPFAEAPADEASERTAHVAEAEAADPPTARPQADAPVPLQTSAAALGSVFQALLVQAEEIARRQGELEARQDTMLGPTASAHENAAAPSAGLEADFDARLARLEQRLAAIGHVEERVDHVQRVSLKVDAELAKLLARRTEVEGLKTLCDTLTTQVVDVRRMVDGMATAQARIEELLRRLGDAEAKADSIESRHKTIDAVQVRADRVANMVDDLNANLEMLTEQRAMVDHVGEKLARLEFTLQEAHSTLRALQREREVAERIEQGIKALRARSGIGKATSPSD